MAVRDDFASGEVLTATDLNDTFASKLPYSYGTATPTTSDDGFLWYDSNSTPPEVKFWDGAAFQALGGGGTILQIVRATDSTLRSTTSTSFTDVTGMSVTITPQKSTSGIMVAAAFSSSTIVSGTDSAQGKFQITDSSNNPLSGAEGTEMGLNNFTLTGTAATRFPIAIVGYSTPATTSAVTYKLRFEAQTSSTTLNVSNQSTTGQMYAIEVSA